MQNLPQQFQKPLSQKQNSFSAFFYYIIQMLMRFRTFSKNDEYPALIITKIIDSERRCYWNV